MGEGSALSWSRLSAGKAGSKLHASFLGAQPAGSIHADLCIAKLDASGFVLSDHLSNLASASSSRHKAAAGRAPAVCIKPLLSDWCSGGA